MRDRKDSGAQLSHRVILNSLFFVMFTLVGATQFTAGAQERKMTRREKENAWREERIRKRETEDRMEFKNDSTEYIQALYAIRNGSWALEASNITFDNGVTHFVTPSTNYLSFNNGTAVLQTAFDNTNIYSPNGLGGITLQGRIDGEELKMDNEGNIYYNFSIQGAQISATVNLVITAYSNNATATVDPNFSSRNMTMNGSIYPYCNAGIIEGSPGY